MTSYMFLNVPGYGHVNATLAVAKELVRRGERVIYYLTEEFRPAIEATGATFRGYESQMGLLGDMSSFTPGLSPNSMPENPLLYILMGESEDVLQQVFERATRPGHHSQFRANYRTPYRVGKNVSCARVGGRVCWVAAGGNGLSGRGT